MLRDKAVVEEAPATHGHAIHLYAIDQLKEIGLEVGTGSE